jgi:Uri superfamily endonuclease
MGSICASGKARLNGTYTLILNCKVPFRVKIGSLGYVNVQKGYCLYTGSALGRGSVSLEGRLNRHFRTSKKPNWHIDYLTSHRCCKVECAVCLNSSNHLECQVNKAILHRLNVQPLLSHAGSSDCDCEGHLLKVELLNSGRRILWSLMRIYEAFGDTVLIQGNCN